MITSRPFETKRLGEQGFDFQEASIEPFGRAEIRAFSNRWNRALPGAGADYRQALEDAIVGRPERSASSPRTR